MKTEFTDSLWLRRVKEIITKLLSEQKDFERSLVDLYPHIKVKSVFRNITVDEYAPEGFKAEICTILGKEFLITAVGAIETEPNFFNVNIQISFLNNGYETAIQN